MANYLGSILGILLILVAVIYVLHATGVTDAAKEALGCIKNPKASFLCAAIDGAIAITGAKQVMGLAERGGAILKGVREGKSVAKAAGKVAKEAKEAGKVAEEVKGAGLFGKFIKIAEHA